jgi:hypothetical protein
MKRAFCAGILSAAAVAACLGAQAQSNVYSLAIYAGGTSYQELCSFTLPFFPYRYKLTERNRYEDSSGLVIIDIGREKARGGVLHRYLDVEIGSKSFTVPLGPLAPERVKALWPNKKGGASGRQPDGWFMKTRSNRAGVGDCATASCLHFKSPGRAAPDRHRWTRAKV